MPRTPLLQPTSRVTCTRRDFTFGDRPPSAVGKPAGVRLSDRPGLAFAAPRATPDHLAVIRPPTAARLTSRCWLRVDRRGHLPSGTLARTRGCLSLSGRGSAVAFSAERRSVGSSPLTSPLIGDLRRGDKHPFCRPLVLLRASDTSLSTGAPKPGDAFHRWSPLGPSCEVPAWGAAPLAGGASPPHVVMDVC